MTRLQNFLVAQDYNTIVSRVNNLKPNSTALWGKMNVSQMMAHCSTSLEQILAEKQSKRLFIGILISWMFKKQYLDERDLNKNSPTAPDFVIVKTMEFEKEKARLLANLQQLNSKKESELEGRVSPFFGALTGYEVARMQYKHLNHHISQFGV